MKRIAVLSCLILLPLAGRGQTAPTPLETPQAAEERLRRLEEQVRALQGQLETMRLLVERTRALEVQVEEVKSAEAARLVQTATIAPAAGAGVFASVAPPAAPAGRQAGATQLPTYGGASSMAKVLNPDIGVIGDFLGSIGRSPVRPVPTLEMHESEASFQAIVDPYARADFFLSFGEAGVNLEEGYMTFTALPGGLVAKVGKMRSAFGVVNMLHNHVLPWVDRPMVTDNLVAGEDGIDDAGLSISRILPAPKGWFLEGTGQVFRGDSGDVFTVSRRSDASVVGRLRAYRDLTEDTNIDLGGSYARGHNDLGTDFLTNLYDIDATIRWKPLRRAIYHSFLARTELIWSRRDQLPTQQRAFGFYTAADYRMSRRWTVGGRFDRSGRARAANLTDTGFSAVLTYWPSEFSQVRGQYRFARYAEGVDGNELRFQFLFVLGAHGAHPF